MVETHQHEALLVDMRAPNLAYRDAGFQQLYPEARMQFLLGSILHALSRIYGIPKISYIPHGSKHTNDTFFGVHQCLLCAICGIRASG